MVAGQYYVYIWYRDVEQTLPFYVGKGEGKRKDHWKIKHELGSNYHLVNVVAQVVGQYGVVRTHPKNRSSRFRHWTFIE